MTRMWNLKFAYFTIQFPSLRDAKSLLLHAALFTHLHRFAMRRAYDIGTKAAKSCVARDRLAADPKFVIPEKALA